eukprot:3295632-Heterocapsa_arctica.AAC.1
MQRSACIPHRLRRLLICLLLGGPLLGFRLLVLRLAHGLVSCHVLEIAWLQVDEVAVGQLDLVAAL